MAILKNALDVTYLPRMCAVLDNTTITLHYKYTHSIYSYLLTTCIVYVDIFESDTNIVEMTISPKYKLEPTNKQNDCGMGC